MVSSSNCVDRAITIVKLLTGYGTGKEIQEYISRYVNTLEHEEKGDLPTNIYEAFCILYDRGDIK